MRTIENLNQFNLTNQEATIYLKLSEEGVLTGYQAAKLTGISRSNTYTSLAGLVEKGAAYVIEGKPTKYTPVKIEEFCNNKIKHLNTLRMQLIEDMPKQNEDVDAYVTISGKDNILDKIIHILNAAEKRVYISITNKVIESIQSELNSCIVRGLKVVVITDKDINLDKSKIYYNKKTQDQIRLITDSKYVLVGDVDAGNNSTCLYSSKKAVIDLIKESLKNEIKLIKLTKNEKE